MRIQSSSIQSGAVHKLQQDRTERQSLQFWTGQRPNAASNPAVTNTPIPRAPVSAAQAPQPSSSGGAAKAELSPKDQLMAEIIRRMIKNMTGKDWSVQVPQHAEAGPEPEAARPSAPAENTPAAQSAGFGLVVDRYMSFEESETLSVQAEGRITTDDGRELAVALNLTMSRSFFTEQRETLRFGDAKRIDPLVVNLGEGGTELDGSNRFDFDLDADGTRESLATLGSRSGFLGLDKNGDGHINDGSELFGALSGDGFAELAGYDQDGNGFIDEGDPVFAKLRVWLKTSETDQLLGLGETGIGALYLGRQDGGFRLADANNQGLGEVKSTGLYVREDGSSGSLQQIDYLA